MGCSGLSYRMAARQFETNPSDVLSGGVSQDGMLFLEAHNEAGPSAMAVTLTKSLS